MPQLMLPKRFAVNMQPKINVLITIKIACAIAMLDRLRGRQLLLFKDFFVAGRQSFNTFVSGLRETSYDKNVNFK